MEPVKNAVVTLEEKVQKAFAKLHLGQDSGLSDLWQLLSRRLLTLLRGLTGSSEDAEDLLQETFAKVFEKIGQHSPSRGSSIGWVYAIARNLGLQHLRRQRRAPPLLEPPSSVDPPDAVEAKIKWEKIEEALQEIPIDLRLAFLLRECLGLNYAQMAQVSDRSPNQVASDLFRARQHLRRILRNKI